VSSYLHIAIDDRAIALVSRLALAVESRLQLRRARYIRSFITDN